MRAYIIRRLLLTIPTLFLVTVIVFGSVRLIPGTVIEQMLQGQGAQVASGEQYYLTIEAIKHKLGLDVPVPVQYGRWIGVWPQESGEFRGALQGDLGNSLWKGLPVTDEIARRLPISIELGFIALVVALLIALPVGVYSAIRQDTGGDYVARSLAIALIAIPGFWLATMVLVFPSLWWHWAPSMILTPFTENPIDNLVQFIIPATILGMSLSGTTMRMTRTMMLEVLRQDYIRTAWSKGLRERTVVTRHALKNALIPVITIIGMNLPVLIGGSVIIEQIFNLPGMGRLLIESLNQRDYTILSGINLIMAVFVLIINLGVDLTYGFLDPRIRFK